MSCSMQLKIFPIQLNIEQINRISSICSFGIYCRSFFREKIEKDIKLFPICWFPMSGLENCAIFKSFNFIEIQFVPVWSIFYSWSDKLRWKIENFRTVWDPTLYPAVIEYWQDCCWRDKSTLDNSGFPTDLMLNICGYSFVSGPNSQ